MTATERSRDRAGWLACATRLVRNAAALGLGIGTAMTATAADPVPVFDVHVHYSHDAVELTPPQDVVELMREAGLSRALVSSSDARGTQALLGLAPDLIVPGLRPYRQRGETGTWVRDPQALAYVEGLLAEHRWASLGEFHLYGADADLPIPRRIAQLAVAHDLVLHAHSDAEAVRRLFAQQPRANILWAHAGFAAPEVVAPMLEEFPRLSADLAFRSDIARGGELDPAWRALIERFPGRFMLGTDTYTPERIHYIPEHAREAREWLAALPAELAQRLATRNAAGLLLARWERNQAAHPLCGADDDDARHLRSGTVSLAWKTERPIRVGQPFSIRVRVCGEGITGVSVDADMPAHRHGMNYRPQPGPLETLPTGVARHFEGLLFHMPGEWRVRFVVERGEESVELAEPLTLP